MTADRGGVAAGRDVIAQLVATGDQNTFFCGDYQPLHEAYIDPWQVFERVRLDRFVGRIWLTDQVDAFLRQNGRGYVVLEAKAGLGKTAFLAHLVKERGWVHHFVERAPGSEGIVPARKNLAAQVIRAFELGDYGAGMALPDEAASRPDFLATLLRDAAKKRAPGEQIVVVVDGLDEAGVHPGENVLGLPDVLPESVFIICSKRPAAVELTVEPPRKVITLESKGEPNLADVREFLRATASSDRVSRVLAASDQTVDEFMDTLVARSGGVWVYLHYVLAEIEQTDGRFDLDAVPQGLASYYAKFWKRWKREHEDRWHQQDLPALATLGAAQSALTLELLRAFTANTGTEPSGIPAPWRPFVDVERGDENRYRLYHKSLQDFLHGRWEGDLDEDERDFADELAVATREAHRRIAQRYLGAWGGIDAGLPGLAADEAVHLDGGYGLQHLLTHLSASDDHDLHRILALERRGHDMPADAGENLWYETHDRLGNLSGYLSGVVVGWRRAEENRELALPELALEARYALMMASLGSLAERVSPLAVAHFVKAGRWTPERALAVADQIPNAQSRADVLQALAPVLPPRLLSNALKLACETRNDAWRAEAIRALAPLLHGQLLHDAHNAALLLRNQERKAAALLAIAERLPAPEAGQVRQEALAAAHAAAAEADFGHERTHAVLTLARVVSALGYPNHVHAYAQTLKQLDSVVEETLSDGGESDRLELVQGLVSFSKDAPDEDRKRLENAALEVARTRKPIRTYAAADRAASLMIAAQALPPNKQAAVLGEAERLADARATTAERAEVLIAIAQHSDDPILRERATATAIAAAAELESQDLLDSMEMSLAALPLLQPAQREQALGQLLAQAETLPQRLRAEALGYLVGLAPEGMPLTVVDQLARLRGAIHDGEAQIQAIAAYVALLDSGRQEAWAHETLANAASMTDEDAKAYTLRAAAPLLAPDDVARAFELVHGLRPTDPRWFGTSGDKAALLADLAQRARPDERSTILQAAFAAVALLNFPFDAAKIINELAPLTPAEARDDVVTTIGSAENLEVRATGLAALSGLLRQPRRDETLRAALEDAAAAEYDFDGARALAVLTPVLAEHDLPAVISIADAIHDGSDRAVAIASLCKRDPESHHARLEAVLHSLMSESWELSVSSGIVALTPVLPDHRIPEMLARAAAFEDHGARAGALLALEQRVRREQRVDVQQMILDTIIEGSRLSRTLPGLSSRYSFRGVIPLLAPRVLPELRQRVIEAALALEDQKDRANAVAAVAVHSVRDDHVLRQEVWRRALHRAAAGERADVLSSLAALAPLVDAHTGADGALAITEEIKRVARWWL